MDQRLTDQILNALACHVKKQVWNAVRMEARLQADLGLDSLAVIVVVLDIEKTLGLSIPWESTPAFEIRTVGDLVAFMTSTEPDPINL
jgi:acyl carrier protein